MPVPYAPPPYNLDFDPRWGEAVEIVPGLRRITARNSSPGTFRGTNTYLIGTDRIAVLDPGPNEAEHLDALLDAIGGAMVDAILLSHTHFDHSALVHALQRETRAPLLLAPGGSRTDGGDGPASVPTRPDQPLADGDSVDVGGVTLSVTATPGHAADHLVYGVEGTDLLFSGDHVMGWNSTIVAAPDGALGPYIDSLKKVIELPFTRYLSGHGGTIEDGPGYARALRDHRINRSLEVIEAVTLGARTRDELFHALYSRVDPRLAPAARRMLDTQVVYLRELGRIGIDEAGHLTLPAGGGN